MQGSIERQPKDLAAMLPDGLKDTIPMTLIEFAESLRKLLLEAEQAGHSIDDIGETADAVLASAWDAPIALIVPPPCS